MQSEHKQSDALHILVIDDDSIDREAVKRALSRRPEKIIYHECATGEGALVQVHAQKFDCIFLDYLLPDMDGITMLRRMHNTDTGLAVAPVVMLTGKGSEMIMIEAIRWGAQDYLIKDNITTESLHIAMTKSREMYELKLSQYQASEQLRQSQKMEAVGQLTSGVAHDFNNLLTVILGNTRIMKKKLFHSFDADDFSRKIDAIEVSARKGADLVRTMMIFTRQRRQAREVVDMNELIEGIDELIRRPLGKIIEITTIYAADLWPVEIDRGQFENALINLAINARDAMPDGGHLTIETANIVIDEEYTIVHPDMTPGLYAVVTVSDTGTGMSPEVAKRIFEPFYTTKPAGEGTGLGLSMVYGMVQQSGGYIHVYSEEGHGTVFRIYMPRHHDSAEDSVDSQKSLPTGTETILIVEDDERLRFMAVNMLERLGYKTIAAENGRIALEILKREHENIALVFSDLLMPAVISGLDLVKYIQEYYPGIKILFTSGYSEKTIPNYHLISGFELIGKPYRKDILAFKIRELLDQGKNNNG
jgi:signal transduction histidine kinase